jgi:hypothetical protein
MAVVQYDGVKTFQNESAAARQPVGTFTIQPVRLQGRSFVPIEGAETFEWTSSKTPIDPVHGGARAAPLQPWTLSGMLRTVRTDYPGARTPSEQVLGPHHEPFTLNGRWDDRNNFVGYAEEEMERFEAMCKQGNLVRIQFQNQSFICLITEWKFDYFRSWYIRYSFTVSVHDRPEDFTRADVSPNTTKSAAEAFDDLDLLVISALETDETEPTAFIDSDLIDNMNAKTLALETRQNALADTLDLREIGIDEGGVTPFRRLATQFRTVRNAGLDIIDDLIIARSDVELQVRTAMSVLNFESWSRSMRFKLRLLMGTASQSSDEMDERDDPNAQRLYRPFQGESLYNVSRRFYGTAHSWRLIANRNALTGVVLTGEELLIIPERGEG